MKKYTVWTIPVAVVFIICMALSVHAQEKIFDDGRFFVGESEKSFSVRPGGKLTITTSSGDVNIKSGTGNSVDVTVIKKTNVYSEEEARDMFKRIRIDFDQRGDDVYIESEFENRWRRTDDQIRLPCPSDSLTSRRSASAG